MCGSAPVCPNSRRSFGVTPSLGPSECGFWVPVHHRGSVTSALTSVPGQRVSAAQCVGPCVSVSLVILSGRLCCANEVGGRGTLPASPAVKVSAFVEQRTVAESE